MPCLVYYRDHRSPKVNRRPKESVVPSKHTKRYRQWPFIDLLLRFKIVLRPIQYTIDAISLMYIKCKLDQQSAIDRSMCKRVVCEQSAMPFVYLWYNQRPFSGRFSFWGVVCFCDFYCK